MASVWKHPNLRSPYWIARYTDATGTRRNRSTKQTDRKAAQKVADGWEAAAQAARRGELTRAAATKALDDLMRAVGLGSLETTSIAEHLAEWHASRLTLGGSQATFDRYRAQIDGLTKFLGQIRAKASVATLTTGELERWRDSEVEAGKAPKTVNFAIATIRAALESAKRKGLILANPADAVEKVAGASEEREPFTDDELSALYKAANAEWRGMIALGVHAGLRLSDAANLLWENVNLDAGTLTFRPTKTARHDGGRPLVVALHTEAVAVLRKLPAGVGRAPLFPSLHGQKPGSAGGLSNQFAALMKKAGVVAALGAEKKGKGRRTRKKGFHALRHAMVTRLAHAKVSADVRRAIAGHASDEIHRRYTHMSVETQREALAKVGRVFG